MAKKTKKETKPASKKTEKKLSVIERLSKIIGIEIEPPHPKDGWRRSNSCAVLKKNYQKIVKADSLTMEEKRAIINKFM